MNKKVQGPLVATQQVNILLMLSNNSTQSRVALNQKKIDQYAEMMIDGVEFDPVIVFTDGSEFNVGSGFHRLNAALKAGFAEFPAEVREGTERDARLFAVEDNVRHGAELTPEDRQNGSTILLSDPECCKLSDKEIARKSGDSVANVAKIRKALEAENPNLAAPVRMVQRKDGKPYAMKVKAIGQKKASKKATAENTVKESAVNGKITASENPSSSPVVSAATVQAANKSEEKQATKNDDLIEALDAQVIDMEPNDVPASAAPANAAPDRYGSRLQVVLGSFQSIETSEGLIIVFGNKKNLRLDVICEMCLKNGATVIATPMAAAQWKFQNLTDKERRAEAEAGI